MSRPATRSLAALIPLSLLWACEDPAPANPVEETPAVGLAELPIALRNAETRPADAFAIDVSPTTVRLDGDDIVTLEGGKVPASERDGQLIAKLHSKLRAGVARRTASVRMHVNIPYETMAMLIGTLRSARVRRVAFEVRKPGPAIETGWLVLDDAVVQPAGDEAVAFEGDLQHTWDEVLTAWDEVYEACRSGDYVGCDKKPEANLATGGLAEISLFARGSGLQARFRRFGEGGDQPKGGGAPLLEGVAPPRPKPGEEPFVGPDGEVIEPTSEAMFTFRYQSATSDPSTISSTFRPVCGIEPCGVVVRGDAGTGSMRLISFIGAAFPNGTPSPRVVFEMPASSGD